MTTLHPPATLPPIALHAPGHEPAMPSRLTAIDVLRVGASGPRARKLRTALSALGVSIGIAALVAVLGLSASSRADLLEQIDKLGTNLVTVEAGAGFGAGDAALPASAAASIGRIPTVQATAAVYELDTNVYRSDYVDPDRTNAITVAATDPSLLDTVSGTVTDGRFLADDDTGYPTAVLGSVAAERLGITDLNERAFVQIGDNQVEVVGILDEFPLAADLDRSVLLSIDAAQDFYDAPDTPTIIYTRVDPGTIDQTRALLPGTADPENPEEVSTSRPSDILEAQAAAESAFTDLFLGLGAVALLVGGVGIANVMVIAVIERRGEIGLRRALGATRAHIRRQFITEATILASLGGVTGVTIGIAVTATYSRLAGWKTVIPPEAITGGLAAALAIGILAGLYPAMRAANLSPTEALRS